MVLALAQMVSRRLFTAEAVSVFGRVEMDKIFSQYLGFPLLTSFRLFFLPGISLVTNAI
jgi:hypothetical protein